MLLIQVLKFESSVIYEGTKTLRYPFFLSDMFESSVIYEGTKTQVNGRIYNGGFESSVIYEGTKTPRLQSG